MLFVRGRRAVETNRSAHHPISHSAPGSIAKAVSISPPRLVSIPFLRSTGGSAVGKGVVTSPSSHFPSSQILVSLLFSFRGVERPPVSRCCPMRQEEGKKEQPAGGPVYGLRHATVATLVRATLYSVLS